MKKLILFVAFCAMTQVTFSQAQISKSRTVPVNILKAFQKSHPKATILKWNDEPPIWEAKYKDGDKTGAISYNLKAKITETELVIPKNQLPNKLAIPDFIKSKYPNEKIQRCEKVEKANGVITYEIQITGKEIIFDTNGKYLSEEMD